LTEIKDTNETLEFFTPDLGLEVENYIEANNKQGIHHIARYQWASMVLFDRKPARVVDVACGAGYGSYMMSLASETSEIIGVDYDERAVQYAAQTYSNTNLSYQTGSMVTWRDGTKSIGECDAIVSFDTIEHLLHRELAMESVANNLKPDGVLLLSTPCGHSVSRLNPGWEHHKLEFSHSDLFKFLSRYFERVIQPQEADFPNNEYWEDVVNKEKTLYLNRMNPVVCLGPKRAPDYKALI
jgi:2-polyprenyl-3-methyl-5-hydroxy-6-metoxy-1,4-benzoquinol methylase